MADSERITGHNQRRQAADEPPAEPYDAAAEARAKKEREEYEDQHNKWQDYKTAVEATDSDPKPVDETPDNSNVG